MTFFIQFLYNMTLSNNPLNCDCSLSYRMNDLVYQLTDNGPVWLDKKTTIFQSKCVTGLNGSAIYFLPNIRASSCQPNPSSYYNCPYFTTTTTGASTASTASSSSSGGSTAPTTTAANISFIAGNAFGLPPSNLSVGPVPISLYEGQVTGIVLAFLALLLILCILLYFICPIECLACCFRCCPVFYGFCPCKNGHKREKQYDLFISFNRNNEKWVRNKLVPFIKGNYIIQNFDSSYYFGT
jgi:hypothetical protein